MELNNFELGYIQKAAEFGYKPDVLAGFIKQAKEIQADLVQQFLVLEKQSNDPQFREKFASVLTKESGFDMASMMPQIRQMLAGLGQQFGGGQGMGGGIAGGGIGGILGLLLGHLTGNPMMGMLLGGLGGAGAGYAGGNYLEQGGEVGNEDHSVPSPTTGMADQANAPTPTTGMLDQQNQHPQGGGWDNAAPVPKEPIGSPVKGPGLDIKPQGQSHLGGQVDQLGKSPLGMSPGKTPISLNSK